MSDFISAASQQLTQALAQLSRLAPQSSAAVRGVEVILQHLAGNVVSVSPSAGQRAQTSTPPAVLLSTKNILGQVIDGKTYIAKVLTEPSPLLQLFASADTSKSISLPLSEQQLSKLLSLPASLLTQNLSSSKGQALGELLIPKQLVLEAKIASIQPQILQIQPKGVASTLSLPVSGKSLEQAIQTQSLVKGQPIQLILEAKGKEWQVTISLQGSTAQKPSSSSGQQALSQALTVPTKELSPLPLLKVALAQTFPKQELALNISPKELPKLLAQPSTGANDHGKTNVALSKLLEQLPKADTGQLSLQISRDGSSKLTFSQPQTQVQIPLTKQDVVALKALNIPTVQLSEDAARLGTTALKRGAAHAQQAIVEGVNVKLTTRADSVLKPEGKIDGKAPVASTGTNPLPQSPKVVTDASLIKPAATQESETSNKVPLTELATRSVKSIIAEAKTQLGQTLQSFAKPPIAPNVVVSQRDQPMLNIMQDEAVLQAIGKANESAIALPTTKPAQVALIQSLLRTVQAKAELPALSLERIQSALSDPAVLTEPSTKEWLEPLVQQLKQALPQGKEQDAILLRQLLSSPANLLSPVQLLSPVSNQGLLGGLVALVQISLASRLLRNQSALPDNIAQTLRTGSGSSTQASSTTPNARNLADFSQLEQKHQLLRELGRLLAGHQANKLSSAEQALQGQDSFYYTLPSAMGDKLKNIELLVKREPEAKDKDQKDGESSKTWQLTMKLSAGELGELLTKARLRPGHVELDLYTSNEETKLQVLNYLPLLKKRLASLGIEVDSSQCQLGKIPDTLQQRPYQLFATKA